MQLPCNCFVDSFYHKIKMNCLNGHFLWAHRNGGKAQNMDVVPDNNSMSSRILSKQLKQAVHCPELPIVPNRIANLCNSHSVGYTHGRNACILQPQNYISLSIFSPPCLAENVSVIGHTRHCYRLLFPCYG